MRRFLHTYTSVAAVVSAAVGVAVLYGWRHQIVWLTHVVSGWPSMKPTTALMAMLSGLALALRAVGRPARAQAAGKVAAMLSGAVALSTVLQYLFGFDVQLDRLLSGSAIGHPSGRTGMAYLSIAGALFSLDGKAWRQWPSLAQLLALIGGSIAGVAVLGFTFNIWELFSPSPRAIVSGMGVHSALTAVLLASGVLATRPDVGFIAALTSEHAGGQVARRLLLGLLAFAPVALLVVTGHRLGWYGESAVSALLVFLALGEGVALIVITAVRLNAYDVRQKKAEERARQSEQRVRRLVSQAPDAIFVADLDGWYTDVNVAGCRLLGLTREQILGRNITDFMRPEQVPDLWKARDEMLRGGISSREWELLHSDGHYVLVEIGAAILADGRWQALVRDISERKRVEAELAAAAQETARLYGLEAQQRAWLRNIVEQMPEGVYILDAAGRPVLTNHALLSFASKNPELRDSWGNPTMLDLRLPDGALLPRAQRPSVRALEHGESTLGCELAIGKDDGALVPVLVSAAPIRDEAGAITGVTIIMQDITPFKDLERLREEWSSVIAHDLRQPLNAISLAAETVQRLYTPEVPDERIKKAIARIYSGAGRLDRMIADLSDASRIEANRLTVMPAPTDLSVVIGSVVEGLRDATGDRAIVVEAPPELWAWVDADRIQQVLTNLITNAAKYGQEATDIRIEAAARGDMIEVAVTNRGRGIPAEQLSTLFSRFGRTREARQSRTPGTGLGLYIAQGLVEAHGGRIWVESTPGETTTFHFVVSRVPASAGADAAAAPA
jgi:PAS domain S-box-containing protein